MLLHESSINFIEQKKTNFSNCEQKRTSMKSIGRFLYWFHKDDIRMYKYENCDILNHICTIDTQHKEENNPDKPTDYNHIDLFDSTKEDLMGHKEVYSSSVFLVMLMKIDVCEVVVWERSQHLPSFLGQD